MSMKDKISARGNAVSQQIHRTVSTDDLVHILVQQMGGSSRPALRDFLFCPLNDYKSLRINNTSVFRIDDVSRVYCLLLYGSVVLCPMGSLQITTSLDVYMYARTSPLFYSFSRKTGADFCLRLFCMGIYFRMASFSLAVLPVWLL